MFKAYKTYWKQYADFEGRSTPADFWWVFLIKFLIGLALFIIFWITIFWQSADFMATFDGNIDAMTDAENTQLGLQIIVALLPLLVFSCLWGLANFIPTYALQVRRLRDAGLHWGFVLLNWSAILIIITAALPVLFTISLLITLACKVTLLVLLGQPSVSQGVKEVYQSYTDPTVQFYGQEVSRGGQATDQVSPQPSPTYEHQVPSGQPQPQGYDQLLGESLPPLTPPAQPVNSAWQATAQSNSDPQQPSPASPLKAEGKGLNPERLDATNQEATLSQSQHLKPQEPLGEPLIPSRDSSLEGTETGSGVASSADSASL